MWLSTYTEVPSLFVPQRCPSYTMYTKFEKTSLSVQV
jgi:hypothetical protein